MSTSIKRHPDAATLMGFAAGSLGEPLSAVVAAHVSVCARCRSELKDMELIGATLLLSGVAAGGGLGRVLGVAARLPYDAVIGFDLSPALVTQARRNLDAIRPRAVCRDLQVAVTVSGDYVVPDTVTVVFCFNPFRGATMAAFLAQVRASLRRRPRALRLVFVNPKHFDVATAPWLTMRDEFRVFDGRMGPTFDYHQTVRVFGNRAPDGA